MSAQPLGRTRSSGCRDGPIRGSYRPECSLAGTSDLSPAVVHLDCGYSPDLIRSANPDAVVVSFGGQCLSPAWNARGMGVLGGAEAGQRRARLSVSDVNPSGSPSARARNVHGRPLSSRTVGTGAGPSRLSANCGRPGFPPIPYQPLEFLLLRPLVVARIAATSNLASRSEKPSHEAVMHRLVLINRYLRLQRRRRARGTRMPSATRRQLKPRSATGYERDPRTSSSPSRRVGRRHRHRRTFGQGD